MCTIFIALFTHTDRHAHAHTLSHRHTNLHMYANAMGTSAIDEKHLIAENDLHIFFEIHSYIYMFYARLTITHLSFRILLICWHSVLQKNRMRVG